MKKRVLSVSVLILILALFTGCSALKEGLEQAKGNDSEGVQTIKSESSSLSMDFPKSWSKENLNDIAAIQMAYAAKEQYMMVIEDTASDFDKGFTIDDYAAIVMENFKTTLEEAGDSVIGDATIGSNIAAKQFELAGTIEKIKVKYFVTCIENNGIFYQLVTWSLPSKYDEAKPVFDNILKSIVF